MTYAKAEEKKRGSEWGSLIISVLMLILMLALSTKLSDDISGFATEGMRIAITHVIPSAFPFMILSDLYGVYGCPERIKPLGLFMERVFGISRCGTRAFVAGNLSGFPIGARATSELYKRGELERSEAERLIALSSSPSPAFVLGAVGHGMLRSETGGFAVLASLFLSQLLLGILLKRKTIKTANCDIIGRQKFDFINSIKCAGVNCISICAFVVFFNCLLGLIKIVLPISYFIYPLTAILEVTGAVSFFASLPSLLTPIRYGVICFSLGFGGLSVMLQSSIFLDGTDLSLLKIFVYKLIHGAIAFILAIPISLLLKL